MATIEDTEFGKISIRRSSRTNHIRLRVSPGGFLRASIPMHTPTILLKRLIKTSRPELRKMIQDAQPINIYKNGQQIGKSHTLLVVQGSQLSVRRQKQKIIVSLQVGQTLSDPVVIRHIRDTCIAALRIEAKSYLPKRIQYIANTLGYSYQGIRFSHASTRWGSCNAQGMIGLNIALMKLPFELIDYVIIHELSHTVEMNHSAAFWECVEHGDPHYRDHRRQLRNETPSI